MGTGDPMISTRPRKAGDAGEGGEGALLLLLRFAHAPLPLPPPPLPLPPLPPWLLLPLLLPPLLLGAAGGVARMRGRTSASTKAKTRRAASAT